MPERCIDHGIDGCPDCEHWQAPQRELEREFAAAAAERDYLLSRIVAEQRGEDLVGLSSTAMLVAAMTGTPVAFEPWDVWDLNRCERTYERAPAHLQRKMLPILEVFRGRVFAHTEQWHRDAVAADYAPARERTGTAPGGGDA